MVVFDCLGVINAVANKTVDLAELLTVNLLSTGLTVVIEYGAFARRETWTPLIYANLELLKPGRTHELLRDSASGPVLPRIVWRSKASTCSVIPQC